MVAEDEGDYCLHWSPDVRIGVETDDEDADDRVHRNVLNYFENDVHWYRH